MKFYLKEKIISWFDSYTIYNKNNDVAYKLKGELGLGHKVKIYDKNDKEIGMIKEKVITILPQFTFYDASGNEIGIMSKKLTFLKPKYTFSFNDWTVTGDFLGWDYDIVDSNNQIIMSASKELLKFTDSYEIDVKNKKNSLLSIMIVTAIDLEKCTDKKTTNR